MVGRADRCGYDGQQMPFVIFMGLTKRILKAVFADSNGSAGLRAAQMPRSPELAIFVL